jgi:hypothetical protein
LWWYKEHGQFVKSGYQPGDVVFFDFDYDGVMDHIGIVESVNGNQVTCIEGNYSNNVARVIRTNSIYGAGRPAYGTKTRLGGSSTGGIVVNTPTTTPVASTNEIQVFTASSQDTIKKWGLLRHFEKVDTPSEGQAKANALLKLYNQKTRELKVKGAFGDINIRGGTLIPVVLDLGDVQASNYMLVEKVKHKFENDHHTMDLTLEGAWEDK